MPLSFLDELDDAQVDVANKIAKKAKELGVDPKLAVALAYAESRLRIDTNDSPKKAIGVMQITPDTGLDMKLSEEDLRNPDVNIDAGVRILKKHLNKYPDDPRLALVAYNAGPSSSFFSGGELPQETKDYIKKIVGYGGIPAPTVDQKSDENKSSAKIPSPKEIVNKVSDSFNNFNLDEDRTIAGGSGALAGFLTGKIFPDKGFEQYPTADLKKTAIDQQSRLSALEKELSGIPESARRAPSLTPNAPPISLNVPEAPAQQTGLERQLQGTIEDGQTGRARQTGFSETTSQQAGRREEMGDTIKRLRQSGVISGRNPFHDFPIGSSPTGLIVPPKVASEASILDAEAQARAKNLEAQAQAQAKRAAQLEKQISDERVNLGQTQATLAEYNRRTPGALSRVGAAFRSPMAKAIPGATIGLGLDEVRRRFETGDYLGTALASAGVLGSGLMMVPTNPSPLGMAAKGAGALLGYGGGLGLLIQDLLQQKQEQQAGNSQISATR
jgi:hypothetical protein